MSARGDAMAAALAACEHVDFRARADGELMAEPATWPAPLREALLLAEWRWRQQEAGRIAVRAVTTACLAIPGGWCCLRRLHFERVRDERAAGDVT